VLAQAYVLHIAPEADAQHVVGHQCTASIGITLFGACDANPSGILKRADAAMYRAKQAGGNQLRFCIA
jgi:GGDEF domain-containing protein